jgi:uncharacterized protein YutE (UPF0331/DUF86 family)
VLESRKYLRLIGFRNILVHGYADIEDLLVWGLVQSKLPELLAVVRGLGP